MEKIQNQIKLKSVSESDYEFLFDLLKERKSINNISHKKMPTYTQHTKFVRSKPYPKWYIVILNKQKIGSVYLTTLNEIGLHFKKEFYQNKLDRIVLDLIMKKNPRARYLININPKNKEKMKFLKKNGFKLIQYTYELLPE